MAIVMLLPRNEVEGFIKGRGVVDYTTEDYTDNGFDKLGDYVRVTFAIGRVISMREANGYHDSDFYATYMRDDGTLEEMEYASTRGWSYANGAFTDATDDVIIAYEAIMRERHQRDEALREAALDKEAVKCNITREQYDRLRNTYYGAEFQAIVKLLSSNLRSSFRIKLANQVRVWLEEDSPKYRTPLSPKQLQYV